jgi:hypothetical protein
MKNILIFQVIALIIFSPFSNTEAQDVRKLKIRSEHPFLFTSPEMLKEIRLKGEDLRSFHQYVKQTKEKSTDDPQDTALIRAEVDKMTLKGHVDYYINDCSYFGIDACVNNNPLSKAYAKQYILSLLDIPVSGDDMPVRGKLFALGALYDWLYYDLDEPLKREMRNEILDLVDYVDSTWHYVSNAVVDGHSRFGNISVLVALLPIYHDVEKQNSERYFKYLQLVIDNWTKKFNPFQTWVNGRGSHSMGWAYGASYSRFFPYIVWEFATDEPSWLTSWHKEKPSFYLYGLRNDYNQQERDSGAYDNFPFSADVWAAEYTSDLHGLQVVFSASHFGDEHSRWFYNHMKQRNINGWGFKDNCWDILYNNFQNKKQQDPYGLPLSKYFPHSSFVVMRDNWDFKKNTLVVFKSASFYAAGHHHKDQNAFTVFYKGPLAIDAGTYEAAGDWGSTHFWNYYTRSVAHNTMLIYDPDEDFRGYSNDGGQYFFESDNPSLEQIKEGGSNHLDGILRYEEGGDYTYTLGDATKAYRQTKLKEFKRSLVYLRNLSYDHPVIVVYDKVVSTKPEFKKTYLLHSIKEPEVNDKTVKITIDDGMNVNNKAFLFQQTILPADARIVKIGGRENNREFFVWDDGTGKPHNYNEDAAYEHPSKRQARELREAGQWRVEISPGSKNNKDIFLNVLSVTDGEEQYEPVKASPVSSDSFDGVILENNNGKESILVLFCKKPEFSSSTISLPKNENFKKILITELPQNTAFKIKRKRGEISFTKTSGGETKSSDQGTIYLKM